MAEEGKKISFGFSKTVKKPVIKNTAPVEEKKVDYIECVDDKSIKIIGNEEKKEEPLVIPMLGSKTWHDRIINKIDADVFEPKKTDNEIHVQNNQETDVLKNGNAQNEHAQPMEVDGVKIKESSEPLTLEQQAAQEIINDLNAKENDSKEQKVFVVPISEDDLKGKEESTLEDYENIPIESFGLAMLRGMGWKAEEGVGKNAKVVQPKMLELRPKGMGLGADKLAVQKVKAKLSKEEENLKVVKGSCVKIISGKKTGSYGKVEGLDEDTGRIFVRLALGNEVVSLVNELLVQPVTNDEYSKNSKVLNMKAYDEHKNKEDKSARKERESSKSTENTDEDDGNKRSKKSKKKAKKRHKESSEDESSPERKSRRKKEPSSSSDEYTKRKSSKKSKKHKSRDSSSERSSRKNRKKDKEREKSRYKKSDYSDSSERARNKDRRRSRSRSSSPKSRRRNRSRSYSPKR